MSAIKMPDEVNDDRRRIVGTAAMAIAAAQLGIFSSVVKAEANEAKQAGATARKATANTSFASLKQIDAGVLNIGYAEAGPANGPAAILLHGWPYDIYSFVDVAPILAAAGYRVIVPYLRGYGSTRFLSPSALRNGEQAAVALDVIALMDALKIKTAVMGGFDWGARTVAVMGVLWPERCRGLVSVSGYLDRQQRSRQDTVPRQPSSTQFGTKVISRRTTARPGTPNTRTTSTSSPGSSSSPKWNFDDATFERTATSFNNPDHVDIVVHNYRWRPQPGRRRSEVRVDMERRLAAGPTIAVPTIMMEGDANGAVHLTRAPMPVNSQENMCIGRLGVEGRA